MRDFVSIENEQIVLADGCREKINEAADRAARLEGLEDFSANIVIADDEYLLGLNQKFRQIDRSTDVLSFPANDITGPISGKLPKGWSRSLGRRARCFGDIFISIEHATAQAEEYGNTLTQELCFLAVHGMLHLLGYDHMQPEEEQVMRQKQREALLR